MSAHRRVRLFLEGEDERDFLKVHGRVEVDEQAVKLAHHHHANVLGAEPILPPSSSDGEHLGLEVVTRG